MKPIECWIWDLSKKFALFWVRPVLVRRILTMVSLFVMLLMFVLKLFVYLYVPFILECSSTLCFVDSYK